MYVERFRYRMWEDRWRNRRVETEGDAAMRDLLGYISE